jgi:rare lipoprotein A
LTGITSYYAEPYHGRNTASGEVFDTYNGMTAAHRTLPFNTLIRVTNEKNGLEVDVRINDRGPFVPGRVIDLSLAAAKKIDMVRDGIVPVELTILKPGAPAESPGAKSAPKAVSNAAAVPAPAAPAAIPSNPRSALPPPPLFTVQAGAFENLQSADALRQELEKRYRAVTIEKTETGIVFYRVRIGRMEEADAKALAEELRQLNFEPYVVRIN